jgi:hypothetical protein
MSAPSRRPRSRTRLRRRARRCAKLRTPPVDAPDVSHRRFFVKAFTGHLDSRRGDPTARPLLAAARIAEILRRTSQTLETDDADDEEPRDN